MTCACILYLVLSSPAQADGTTRTVRGVVFHDLNGDGRRDSREPGVASVKVSNGRDIVRTDAQGRYRLPLRDGDTLFVIKPAGWSLPRDAEGLPASWSHEVRRPVSGLRYGGRTRQRARSDFALLADGDPTPRRRMFVFGDPQPKSQRDVQHFADDIVAPLSQPGNTRFGISLGDVVDDDLSLYPAMKRVMQGLALPWVHIPGNHDLDYDAASDEASLESYRAAFGPDTLAWEEPGLAFIGMDDVIYRPTENPRYVGGLRDDQFLWLERYLATLDPDTLVIIGMHIHLFDSRPGREDFRSADRLRLFKLLESFPNRLLLTAHAHAQRHVWYGPEQGWHGQGLLHEYNVGTACGGYWGGVADAAGIPDATMEDGTPNGYATLDWDEQGQYQLLWHVARAPDDDAIRLHAPRVLRQGAWPGVRLYANVYMGDADSVVEMRVDDGPWQPMQHTIERDPWVIWHNLQDDAAGALRGYDRMTQAEDSTHLWRMNLPTDLALGTHRIDVRALDRWRGWVQASTSYRLAEWP
ncbi:MAG: calcineurin-like phosphoesterase family protein [Xanthomonadales bacterium]|nr:calcineurin-like phosphoesterase family protein [Xanthomonadales bacterium]